MTSSPMLAESSAPSLRLYFLSRAAFSALTGVWLAGPTLSGAAIAASLFVAFWIYAKNGWFAVDGRYPLRPLRRDERAREAQRRSLVTAIAVGLLVALLEPTVAARFGVPSIAQGLPLGSAVLAYFVSQGIRLGPAFRGSAA